MADTAAAVAAAAAIAAKLSAQLRPAAPAAPSVDASVDPATITDPVARAKAIAARLAASIGGSSLGKRKADEAFGWSNGEETKKRKKIYVPTNNPEMNYLGLLIGPRGATQKRLEQESGARIFLRGRGANKDVGPNPSAEDLEDLHVLIVGDNDDVVSRAEELVNDLLFNEERAKRVKNEQLRGLAAGRAADGMNAQAGPPPGMMSHGGMGGGGRGGPQAGEISITFGIPALLAGGVIGRGGENIKMVQIDTATHVQIQAQSEMMPGQVERMVTVTGAPDRVENAKQRILQLVEEKRGPTMAMMGGPGAGIYGPGGAVPGMAMPEYRATVQVPDERAGGIIGRGGATIKSIQMRCGANIQVPKYADPDNPRIRTVTITAGSQQAADAAAAEIYALLAQPEPGPRGGGGGMGGGMGGGLQNTTIFVQVPNEKAGQIIGSRGATIRELEMTTGTRIQVPQQAEPGSMPPTRSVEITGAPHAVEMARQRILNIVSTPGMGGGMGMGGMGMGGGMGGYGMGGGAMGGLGGYGAYGAQAAPAGQGYGAYGAPAAAYGAYGYGAQPAGGAAAGAGAADPYAAYYAQQAQAGGAQPAAAAAPAAAGAASSSGAGGSDADNAKAWEEYYKQYAAYYQALGVPAPPIPGMPGADAGAGAAGPAASDAGSAAPAAASEEAPPG